MSKHLYQEVFKSIIQKPPSDMVMDVIVVNRMNDILKIDENDIDKVALEIHKLLDDCVYSSLCNGFTIGLLRAINEVMLMDFTSEQKEKLNKDLELSRERFK